MYLSLVTVAVPKLINVVENLTLLHITQKLLHVVCWTGLYTKDDTS